MVQLRSGMGIGVKADVLAYLLCVSRHGQNWASIGSIVDALGYGKAAVGNATEEMCAAKFILAPGAVDPQARTPKMFRADPTAWASVLGLNDGSPSWTYWDQHYLFLTKYLAWHQEVTDRNVTDYALAVQLRALLEAHPRALTTDRAGAERAPEVVDQIPEFLERRMTTWQNWFRNLG